MDTSRLKKFAAEARNILKQGVITRLSTLGYDADGKLKDDKYKAQQVQGKTLFMGQLYEESFYGKWMALNHRIETYGIKEVYEEAAYTWFNRLMAIRIMAKNGFIEPVLEYADENLRIPRIVDMARKGQMPDMDDEEREQLRDLMLDDSKTVEQFAVLIVAFCRSNPVISKCFGGISEYTELLLPTGILSAGGFIDLLNNTPFITDDDYKQSELIGWLYQFYISEKKDEVFASFKGGKKAEAEDIPAATQIFTPNWIVKYMVQNTVGRIYLDNNPGSGLGENWKYLVEPSEPTPEDCKLKIEGLEELTMADLGCGSGHILNEGFDLLYDLYIDEGYSRKQAVESIFRNNLTGVDIDTRAKQLATFALMMKACQKDRDFLDCHVLPRVLDMPEVDRYTYLNLEGHFCAAYGIRQSDAGNAHLELAEAFTLMQQAHNLGSVMRFDTLVTKDSKGKDIHVGVSEKARKYMRECVEAYEKEPKFEKDFAPLVQGYKVILALTEKYATLVMNPPYMGSSNMNAELSAYVQQNYPEGKADLFSTFMIVAIDRLRSKGKYGMINMHSWMFLSSFEALRRRILKEQTIDNMLHLGPRTFDELSGEVVQNTAYVITKIASNYSGVYFRLVDGRDCAEKEQLFFEREKGVYYQDVPQCNFSKIPSSPIGYWISQKMISLLSGDTIGDYYDAKQGIATCDNNRFLRLWFEISSSKFGIGFDDSQAAMRSGKKWFPYRKGGAGNKWYGNQDYVVNYENDGREMKDFISVLRNPPYYFKEAISWSLTSSSNNTAFRYFPKGFLFDVNGMSLFPGEDIFSVLGFLNTKATSCFLKVINPTMACQIGDVVKLPVAPIKGAEPLVLENISISRADWDAHETSWDFATNELLTINGDNYINILNDYSKWVDRKITPAVEPNKLEWRVMMYKMKWDYNFSRLHWNEEELNRQFIEIYGLQDELGPYVPEEEITILQQGEIRFLPVPGCPGTYSPVWNDDVIMKQLISYAIGCMMGRYRLDKPGLHIAHPNPTSDEVCTYNYGEGQFTIDDDAIIPLLSHECSFDDNGVQRVVEFMKVAFGEEKLTENLNYMEACLGKSIEDYLKKDFWKDHKKMYQNRPIYWLFSSKKGAFQVLVYMHRMNRYTVEQIRNKYLLPHIKYLAERVEDMENHAAQLNTTERRTLERLKKELEECQEYHERLHVVADNQVSFDLDDGVVVNYAKFGDVLAKIK